MKLSLLCQLQWLQDPRKINSDKQSKVRHETSGDFRWENLKGTINVLQTVQTRISETCIQESMNLRRVTRLELTLLKEICLQISTALWIGGRNTSVRYGIYFALIMFGKLKYIQLSPLPLRMRLLMKSWRDVCISPGGDQIPAELILAASRTIRSGIHTY